MPDERLQPLQALLLSLLPADHGMVGNITLQQQFLDAAARQQLPASADDFQAARATLLAQGLAVKGKGRGGATARATGHQRPDFALHTPTPASAPTPAPAPAPRKTAARKAAPPAPATDGAQVLAYRHPDRRKNNPEVGLVNADSDPEQPKTRWAYDPHLDPALQFDSARAQADALIDDALASGDARRHARTPCEDLQRMGAPYLQWTGKAERTSFEVDTVSLHVHERIDADEHPERVGKRKTLAIGAASARTRALEAKSTQLSSPACSKRRSRACPCATRMDFYKHDRGWANRLVAGDSLLVMNSLLQKEGMAGQVQMIYIDPPYGIKYGSNFQPFVGKRDVKDRSDADLTQEPEMIKAFRDTWELGIHSYLTYLRDRLLLAQGVAAVSRAACLCRFRMRTCTMSARSMDEVFGARQLSSV
ncbi:MAG: hypothetical protein V9G22_01930 [Ottowia sp.]